MSYILRKSGHPVLPNTPALAYDDETLDCVDISAWLDAIEKSDRLREVKHPGERPTAFFKRSSGQEAELIYVFGYVVPVKHGDLAQTRVIEELAQHLNALHLF